MPFDEFPKLSSTSKIYMLPTEGALFGEWPLMVKYGGGYEPERWDRHIQGIQRFFLWGDYSRRVLRATGRFRDEQLVVVGAPRMDYFLAEASPAEKAAADPSSVGAISNFLLTNPYHDWDIFQLIDGSRKNGHGFFHAETRNIEDRFGVESGWIRVWLELFHECQRRGERLKIRVHPREKMKAYDYLRRTDSSVVRFDDQDMPFEAWLDRLGVLLGYNSTAFFEAVAANRAAINMGGLLGDRLKEHIDGFPQNHYPIMEFIDTPSSFEELFEFARAVRSGEWTATKGYGPEVRALVEDVCHFPRRKAALAAIVETVARDLGESVPRRRFVDTVRDAVGRGAARAVEMGTFRIRRDIVVSSWFPLECSRLERQYATEIARYIRAGDTWDPS